MDVLSNIPDQQLVELHSGDDFACAIAIDGEITCWGDNNMGKSASPSGLVQQLDVGDAHACCNAQWEFINAGDVFQVFLM